MAGLGYFSDKLDEKFPNLSNGPAARFMGKVFPTFGEMKTTNQIAMTAGAGMLLAGGVLGLVAVATGVGGVLATGFAVSGAITFVRSRMGSQESKRTAGPKSFK